MDRNRRMGCESLEERYMLSADSNEVRILTLAPAEQIPELGKVEFIETADLNQDGFPDLVAGTLSDEMRILIGSETGEFTEFTSYSDVGPINSVDFGDLNHDGRIDIVVAGTTNLSTLLSNDIGKWDLFDQQEERIDAIRLLDFNVDGELDLLTRTDWSQLSVRKGQGDGAFDDAVTYVGKVQGYTLSQSELKGQEVLEGDVNHDGYIDLVRPHGEVTEVLFNDGNGIFDSSMTINNVSRPLALFDLNGDQRLDLLTVHGFVHLGQEDGNFGGPVHQINYFVNPSFPTTFAADFEITDINNDGHVDLLIYEEVYYFHFEIVLIADVGSNVYFGNGDGTFGPPLRFTESRVITVDLDSEGIVGFVGYNSQLIRQVAPETFSTASHGYGQTGTLYESDLIDLNGDNRPDFVGFNFTDVFIRFANDDGFGKPVWVNRPNDVEFTVANVLFGDFSGDGVEQLALEGRLSIWFVDISGTTVGLSKGPSPLTDSRILDVDQDGKSDILSFNNDMLRTHLNRADDGWTTIDQPMPTQGRRKPIAVLDANSDGFPDIVLDGRVLINKGDGSWDPWRRSESARGRVEYADFDGDGFADQLWQDSVSLSDKNGGWLRARSVELPFTSFNSVQFQFVHVNNDVHPDLIYRDYTSPDTLQVAIADGAGSFQNPIDTAVPGLRFWQLEFSDLDGDGFVDFQHNVAIYEGDGQGRFMLAADETTFNIFERREATGPAGHAKVSRIEVHSSDEAATYIVPARWALDAFDTASDEVLDLDLDGDTDLVLTHDDGFVVVWGIGEGDLDRDGKLTTRDVDLLRTSTSPTTEELLHLDLNKDQFLNEDDVRYLIEEIAHTRLGDTNFDGDVDFLDFLVVADNFGSADADWANGDFDGDGEVNFLDFMALADNFGFQRSY